EPHAERKGPRDVALLLDGVAIGDAVGRGASRQHHLDLGDRGGVEAGAQLGEQAQDLRRRVRLHGVEHARVGQRLGEGLVVVTDDVEIDDQAWCVVFPLRASLAEELADALGHGALPTGQGRIDRPDVMRVFGARSDPRWGRVGATTRGPDMLPWFGWGDPVRTAGNEEQASSVARAGGWRTGRDQKSPLRRCFKPRPPWRTRCAGFASGCQSSVSGLKRSDDLAIVAISLRAAVRPLVRMPTD